jgi:hypothetical protein
MSRRNEVLMSGRTRAVLLTLSTLVALLQPPLHAKDTHVSPFFEGGVIEQGDVLRSGNGCLELSFHFADGYYNRLNLRGVGGEGCGNSHWDSYSDFDWQGFGHGQHGSSTEPRGQRAARAIMQGDGNFVVYDVEDGVAVPVWSTNTAGNPGAYLNVQDDGNMVIYSATHAVLWSLF